MSGAQFIWIFLSDLYDLSQRLARLGIRYFVVRLVDRTGAYCEDRKYCGNTPAHHCRSFHERGRAPRRERGQPGRMSEFLGAYRPALFVLLQSVQLGRMHFWHTLTVTVCLVARGESILRFMSGIFRS
jgi:hypothetical protein